MSDTVALLTTSVHTGNGTQTLQGEKVKGDAYVGQTDGLHTIVVHLNDFIGKIVIQGSLETTPGDNDWFDVQLSDGEFAVDVSGKITSISVESLLYSTAETSRKAYNGIGNFVWIRANITDWTSGTITSIEMNH